jgi:eukaryotic-like serine/threonine-protein kinase
MPAALLQLDHIIVGHDLTIRDVTIHQYFSPELRDPASRNRRAMIEKVWAIWITGVLQPSLPHDILLDLGLTERPAMVTRTLDLYVQRPDPVDLLQAPGTRLVDVFDRLDRALLILGSPGAGKTTLLLTLAQDLLTRAAQDPEQPIPVMFPLSSWAERQWPLAAWLVEALNEQYDVPRKIAQAWVTADQILPLLDGLDEVAAEHRAACVEAINVFRQEHGLLPLAVCSRVADYDALGTQLRLQGALVVQPLTREQVESYLTQAGPPLAAMRQALQEDPMIEKLLDTPLMLTIVTLAYVGEPVEALRTRGTPGQRRQHLFAVYVDRMFRRRGVSTCYPRQQIERWLTWLAGQMTQHSQTVFYLERMQPDWLPRKQRWLPRRGARLVAGLVGVLAGGMSAGPVAWLFHGPLEGLVIGLLVGLVAGIVGGLAGYSREITSIETVRWSGSRFFSELLRPSGRRLVSGWAFRLGAAVFGGVVTGGIGGLPYGLGTGLGIGVTVTLVGGLGIILSVGLVFGLLSWLGGGMSAGLVRVLRVGMVPVWGIGLGDGLLFGLGVGLLIGLVYQLWAGFAAGLSGREIATKTTPNEGIYRSARMALISGVGSGLLFGLGIGLLTEQGAGLRVALKNGLLVGVLVGLPTGLKYGGQACLQHLMLRLGLRHHDSAPWHYIGFLDYAAERLFLRKVGGGYIFIHRLLQDYFAARHTDPGDASKPNASG